MRTSPVALSKAEMSEITKEVERGGSGGGEEERQVAKEGPLGMHFRSQKQGTYLVASLRTGIYFEKRLAIVR